MAAPWLLIAVVGLVANVVSCQGPTDFANPPPLPAVGMLLCIIMHTVNREILEL